MVDRFLLGRGWDHCLSVICEDLSVQEGWSGLMEVVWVNVVEDGNERQRTGQVA
jgi:hypothetical protein